jgi:hypothetical protein
VSSGAGAEVVGEDGRTVYEEEADEAESGVEALAGSCGDRPPRTAERRERQNVSVKSIDLMATTEDGAFDLRT